MGASSMRSAIHLGIFEMAELLSRAIGSFYLLKRRKYEAFRVELKFPRRRPIDFREKEDLGIPIPAVSR